MNEIEILDIQIDDKTKIDKVIKSLPDTFKDFKVSYILSNKDMTLIELMHKLHAIKWFYHRKKLLEKWFSSRPRSKDKNKYKRVGIRKLSEMASQKTSATNVDKTVIRRKIAPRLLKSSMENL